MKIKSNKIKLNSFCVLSNIRKKQIVEFMIMEEEHVKNMFIDDYYNISSAVAMDYMNPLISMDLCYRILLFRYEEEHALQIMKMLDEVAIREKIHYFKFRKRKGGKR